jgi:hypothetical protein
MRGLQRTHQCIALPWPSNFDSWACNHWQGDTYHLCCRGLMDVMGSHIAEIGQVAAGKKTLVVVDSSWTAHDYDVIYVRMEAYSGTSTHKFRSHYCF